MNLGKQIQYNVKLFLKNSQIIRQICVDIHRFMVKNKNLWIKYCQNLKNIIIINQVKNSCLCIFIKLKLINTVTLN
jgi:hypothetical protein